MSRVEQSQGAAPEMMMAAPLPGRRGVLKKPAQIVPSLPGCATRPSLDVGICGEHGDDPKSIDLCHRIGLNYISCSPFRVPIARLAAAHAAIAEKERKAKK